MKAKRQTEAISNSATMLDGFGGHVKISRKRTLNSAGLEAERGDLKPSNVYKRFEHKRLFSERCSWCGLARKRLPV